MQFFERCARARGEHGTAQKAERHVGAEARAYLSHLVHAQMSREQLVESQHHRRAVGRASGKPRLSRDLLVYFYSQSLRFDTCMGKERPRRLTDYVAVIAGYIGISGTAYLYLIAVITALYSHGIVQRHRLHDHGYIVVTVGTLADDIECEIYLSGSFNRCFHLSTPRETL